MKQAITSRSGLAAIVVMAASWTSIVAETGGGVTVRSGHHAPWTETAGAGYMPRAGGTTLTVGPDGNCDHAGLQAAIDAAGDDDLIRVMDDGGYTGSDYNIHGKALTIRGGYDDCNAGSTPSGRTVLDAGGTGQVVDIWYPAASGDPEREVNLENLVITGGGGTGLAGGVLVEGRPGKLGVNLRNVEISGNARDGADGHGAGLRVIATNDASGTIPLATVDNDSVIVSNTAGGDGGGIYCESTFSPGSVTLVRIGTTLVFDNMAENGGGMAVNGCGNVFSYSGGPFVLIVPAGGFVSNEAVSRGGGMYVHNGGEVTVRATAFAGFGDPDEAALIASNSAPNGAGVYLTDPGSVVYVEDAYVINNSAQTHGGAFQVSSDAYLEVRRPPSAGPCEPPMSGGGVFSRPPCSVIEGNSAGNGGGGGAGLSLLGSASADVSRTIIRGNSIGSGGSGTIATVRNLTIDDGPPSELRIEGSLMTGNDGNYALQALSSGIIDVYYSTLVQDTGAAARVAAVSGRAADLSLYSSIVDAGQPVALFDDGSLSATADCVIGTVPAGMAGYTGTSFYSDVDPQFVDPGNGDYHLAYTSPAIDYCDGDNPPAHRDLDGDDRNAAWTGPMPDPAPNPASGDYDLGAYEALFVPPMVGLSVQVFTDDRFIDAGQSSLFMQVEVRNNGPEDAAGQTQLDDSVPAELSNLTWNCSAFDGATCPADGSGPLSTQIPPLPAGSRVVFVVIADVDPGMTDDVFGYSAMITPSGFDDDAFTGDDDASVTFETGLLRDGFES